MKCTERNEKKDHKGRDGIEKEKSQRNVRLTNDIVGQILKRGRKRLNVGRASKQPEDQTLVDITSSLS